MTVICAEPNPFVLCKLQGQVRRILPEADIHICRSPEEVKKRARISGCDVLITEADFGSRKGEGIHLAQEIQTINPHVNIIFATAGSEYEYAAQILKLRASGLLIKPFTNKELREELINLRYSKGVCDAG